MKKGSGGMEEWRSGCGVSDGGYIVHNFSGGFSSPHCDKFNSLEVKYLVVVINLIIFKHWVLLPFFFFARKDTFYYFIKIYTDAEPSMSKMRNQLIENDMKDPLPISGNQRHAIFNKVQSSIQ